MSEFFTSALLLAQAAPPSPPAGGDSNYALVLITLAVLVVPAVLGIWLARIFRMPDYGWKIGAILVTVAVGATITWFGWPPKRGIDLAGGVILVYEVQGNEKVEMDKMVAAIRQRLDPAGVMELTIRPYGPRQVEIIIPQVESEEIELIKRKISSSGFLEFRITADPGKHREIIQQALALENAPVLREGERPADPTNPNDQRILALARELPPTAAEVRIDDKVVAIWQVVPEAERAAVEANPDLVTRQTPRGLEVLTVLGRELARWVRLGENMPADGLITRQGPGGITEALVVMDEYNVTGAYLARASQGIDEAGRNAVNFTMNTRGARLFGAFTYANRPDPVTNDRSRLGIVLDDVLLSAPVLNEPISSNGQISGQFTQEDIDFLVGVLNAGSLPAALNPEPLSQQTISPTLGEDTIRQGVRSMLIASVLVLGFMLVYYRFAGVVACVVLLLNLLLVVALMITVKAAFTLPGLAGLALTVGMAVDANVLIYERMREELNRGSALRMAIRNGFDRATGTIVDANLTTLIVALVLYAIGSDQIKGFAVTLILGIVLSMYTAIFCARVVFDIAERNRWITNLRMMRLLENANYDFVSYYKPAVIASTLVILVGIGALFARGAGILDIDFTGGSSVHILFDRDKPQQIADIRAAVAELPDVTVVSIGEDNLEFKIDTSARDTAAVRARLAEIFGDDLRTNVMQVAALEPIPDTAPPTGEAGAAPAPPPPGPAAQPTPEQGARADLPSDNLIAMAQPATPPADADEATDADQPAEAEAPAETGDNGAAEDQAEDPSAAGDAAPQQGADAAPAADDQQPPADAQPLEAPATEQPVDAPDQVPAPAPGEAAVPPPAAVPPAEKAPIQGLGQPVDPPAALRNPYAGGTQVRLEFTEPINDDALRARLGEAFVQTGIPLVRYEVNPVVPTGMIYVAGSNVPFSEWDVKIAAPPEAAQRLLEELADELAGEPVFPSSSSIGQRVAGDTQVQAFWALLISLIGIIVYVWFRFQNLIWGVASVVALVHDVLIMLTAIAVSAYIAPYLGFLLIDPVKIGLTIVAAFLTIIGYSINDTIVIFDRMREVKGKSPELTPQMINASVNQTLSRSIITSLTVLIVVLILYIWGGEAMHGFAFALLVGVISGSYSTIFIAAPLVLWLAKPRGANRRTAGTRSVTTAQPQTTR